MEDAGGVTLELAGTLDLTTRLQGRSAATPEPTPITQTIAVDVTTGRVSHTIDWRNYSASRQHLREVYEPDGQVLFLDLQNSSGGWMPQSLVHDPAERFTRYVPQFVLADALSQRDSLDGLGRVDFDGRAAEAVQYTTTNGDTLVLYIDPDTSLVRGLSSVLPMPLLGDTEMLWIWSAYRSQDGLELPDRLTTRLADRVLKDARVEARLGASPEAFDVPSGIAVGERPSEPAPEFVPYGQREPDVETVAPGVYFVRNLRAGFHLLFVEFSDHVVAVDAPTGWYEMEQVPPMNWSAGDATSALGAKYIRAIRQTVPDKPISSVILTHHHSDHIGGLRPFLAEGARVIAGASAARMAQRAADASFALSPDVLTGRAITPEVEVVDGSHRLADASMELNLIELPDGNPKADDYLMVYLPAQRILYTTAFIYPVPEAVFPPRESIDLSIYFVDWLDRSGLDVDLVLNVHGTGVVEPWHLERIRQIARERAGLVIVESGGQTAERD
jgi:glyoxylase-like metal-dependent hydrolase (beta-lactamase superfamily II)